ncbi:hypothetical protein BG004_004491 [Podila humilis]|nr:hypothetical protein BG004_004491 [Podila humilis]
MTTAAANASSNKTIKVDIVSDVACPWCYIGKKRLEKAITSFKASSPDHKDVNFEVNWHPYQLDPAASKTPIPKMTMYARKFGQERAPLLRDRMIEVGKEEGIPFSYNGGVCNTLDSHRLIAFAKRYGKQDEMVNRLFVDYFEQDKCGEIPTLIDSAEAIGLDRTKVEQFLASEEGTSEILKEIQNAKSQNVQGVPNFTIQDRYVLSGAQDPSTFEDVFKRII